MTCRHSVVRLATACALLIPAAFCAASPSETALRFKTDGPRNAIWQKMYDALPSFFKTKRTVVIEEVTDEGMEKLLAAEMPGQQDNQDSDSVVDGYYRPGSGGDGAIITLRKTLEGENVGLVFLHEYAHFLWETKLTARQRDDYRNLWKRARRNDTLVTAYAAESVEEGFADTLAYYVRKGETLKRKDREGFKYMSDLAAEPDETRK